jgi:hypothetical protein
MWLSLRPGIRVSIHGNHFRSGDLTMNHVVAFVLMVVASVNTDDAAVLIARDIVNAMLAKRPDVRKVMVERLAKRATLSTLARARNRT